jgi:phage gpG-like protein
MQYALKLTKNTVTPDLARKLKAAKDPKPALEAAGLVVVQRTVRAFDEPGVRPAPWQALKASSLASKAKAGKSNAILKRDGVLWRSIRITSLTSRGVTIGTDRFYAKFHQLGTRRMPARPFFPFDKSGRLESTAASRVESAIRIKLRLDA